MSETTHSLNVSERDDRLIALIVYVLFIVGPANGLTMVIGVVLAALRYDKSAPWLKTHYQFQLRTAFFGFLFFVLGLLTVWIFGLGLLVWAVGTLWVVVRAIVGLVRVIDQRPNPDPTSFLV
ncbi:hypothetical protein [Woodsholea maritima]|uniref:hypothetical protein n=1 Tax=Woodsholea maritima TaxID=240237 RepID=UPI000360E9BF|nr:hypothetical protein [Woodsholea maritima]